MKQRRRLWLCLLLLQLVAALVALPAVHWRVIGCVKQEAFYQGRPTSYWAGELQQWGSPYYRGIGGSGRAFWSGPFWVRQSSWLGGLKDKILGSTATSRPPFVAVPDPASVPVLIELLAHE